MISGLKWHVYIVKPCHDFESIEWQATIARKQPWEPIQDWHANRNPEYSRIFRYQIYRFMLYYGCYFQCGRGRVWRGVMWWCPPGGCCVIGFVCSLVRLALINGIQTIPASTAGFHWWKPGMEDVSLKLITCQFEINSSNLIDWITMKICTWHDSNAVVACAKSHCHHILETLRKWLSFEWNSISGYQKVSKTMSRT